MFQANVSQIAERFTYEFPPLFVADFTATRAALTANNFNPKLIRQLCPRHSFLRALREWLAAVGNVDHTISAVLDSRIFEDENALSIQIDDKWVSSAKDSVQFSTRAIVTVDKMTGHVTCSNPAVQSALAAIMPKHLTDKNKNDIGRLIVRLMENAVGSYGLIPTTSARTYYVFDTHKVILDRICAFIVAIGGTVERRPEYDIQPTTLQPNPVASVPAVVPSPVGEALSDQICRLTSLAEEKLREFHKKEWKSPKCKEKALQDLKTSVTEASDTVWKYKTLLDCWNERLLDHCEYVKALFNPPVAAPIVNEVVTYTNDPDDDISVIENVSTVV